MPTNLSEWLHYLERRNSAIILGLDRVKAIAEELHLRHFSAPVVLVAGTNGKGSTVAAIAALASAAQWRIASYTSPHVCHFNERLCINNKCVTDESLCNAFKVLNEYKGAQHLTYFEFITLACLSIIRDISDQLDLIVLEIGLGGRLDVVNIVAPSCSVITAIDIDHTTYLGDNREAIGREKAGILRAGVPFICADTDVPKSVLSCAESLAVEAYYLGKDYGIESVSDQTVCWWHGADHCVLATPLLHCNTSAAALMVAKCLGFYDAAKAGVLSHLRLSGRFQAVAPNAWVDVAHNPHAVAYLAQKLLAMPVAGKRIAVCSMLNDKDMRGCFQLMAAVIDEWHIAPLGAEQGASLADLQAAAATLSPQAYATVAEAWQAAYSKVGDHDILIGFGSFHTVAEILSELTGEIGI